MTVAELIPFWWTEVAVMVIEANSLVIGGSSC
jgi:hypothetical protein